MPQKFTDPPAKLSKYADKNAVATSWMMAQARGDRDTPSEPLGNFYWSMRPVSKACNFARGVLEHPRVKANGRFEREIGISSW